MKYITLALIYILLVAPAAIAQQQVDRFDIDINVENERDQAAILNLANTFALLAPRTSGLRRTSRLDFRSGTGLVKNDAATIKLNSALPDALAQSVAQRQTMSSPCDISRHRFAETDVLLAVHNADTAQPQDVYRCFIVGLWIYHTGSSENVDVQNWGGSFARTISSLTSGNPAFSGFEIGEN